MSFKPYEKYKDSGVEWLKQIPFSWELIKLKYLCDINTGSKDTQDSVPEGIYPFFVRSDVVERINEYTHNEEAVLTAGDGVGVGRVFHYFNGKFAAHQRVYIFTNFKKSSAKFIYYYLKSNLAFEVLRSNAKSTVDSLRRPMLANFIVSLPSLEEQEKIVEFLDQKTTEIDAIIEKKKQQIQLLQQYRQCLITETVTRGLNPNVKMKDSGVDWIGQIPEHWNVSKIKYTTYVKGRIGWHGLKSDEFIDEGPYLVTGTDFKNGKVDWETCYHISEKRYKEAPEIQLRENDLLITKDGSIGKLAMVEGKPEKAILNSGIFVTRPLRNEYISKFLFWILSSDVFKKFIEYFSIGSTIKHLYQETFVNFSYPLPDLKEQEEIVRYLDEKTSKIDIAINSIQNQIEIIAQYRELLIYEAVTGKIDVRNYNGSELEVKL